MASILSGSIDVSKIDKTKILSVDKNGNPFKNGAKYLSVSIIVNDELDQYGHIAAITQGQSKEERENKTPKVYLGNLKEVWTDTSKQHPQSNQTKKETPLPASLGGDDSDLPF